MAVPRYDFARVRRVVLSLLLAAACGNPDVGGGAPAPGGPAGPSTDPVAVATPAAESTYYISPAGSDASDGRTPSTPFRTFGRALRLVPPGGALLLLDGVYAQAATGGIEPDSSRSGQPASGLDL